MTNQQEIPTYTKIGFRITIILLLVISAFLLRNCTKAVYYGTTTPESEIQAMYQRGYADGRAKANNGAAGEPYDGENILLLKSYRKGFRDGWDEGRAPNRR